MITPMSQNRQEFSEVRPYILGLVALLLKLRFNRPVELCFAEAGKFISRLEEEIK